MNGNDVQRYKKHCLDFEKTVEYFVDHIQCGKTFSQKIVKSIDFNKGKFFTFLPSSAALERLYKFSYGGIIPSILYDKYGNPVEGQPAMSYHKEDITMDEMISMVIKAYLKRSCYNYAIIENYMLESESPHVIIKNVEMIPYEKEVYFFLSKKNSIDEICNTIRKSSQVWHFLCFLKN